MFELGGQILPDRLEGPIFLDTETKDTYLKSYGPGWAWENRGYIAGIAISADNFTGYLPIKHMDGNVDREKVISWLNHNLSNPVGGPLVAFNSNYDVGWMRREGIRCNRVVEDVMLQAPLIDEHRFTYGLDDLGRDYLGERKDELGLKNEALRLGIKISSKEIKMNLWRMDPEVVGQYALQDVALTKKLWYLFNKKLADEELERTYALERDLQPLVLEMRWRGVRVDLDRGEELVVQYQKKEDDAIKEVKRITGIDITGSLSKSAALAKVLEQQGVPYPLTEKTQKPSITKELLAASHNPVCQLIRQAQKFERFRTLFVENYVLDMGSSGRIHGQLNQLKTDEGGTVSGRFSSTMPNLQQIPSNDKADEEDVKLGTEIRGLFLAEEGAQWMVGDYSQQEPRWMVEMAHRSHLKSARTPLEIYQTNPKVDFHQMTADLTGLTRKQSKPIGLGLAYAMGGAKLAIKLGLPTAIKQFEKNGKIIKYEAAGPEAQLILDKYNQAVPFVRELDLLCRSAARKRGWIRTPLGRRFRFPVINGERHRTHKAMNALIQGVAADETKSAMVAMWREGIVPVLTVHDELDFNDITSDKEAMHRRDIMLSALPKSVPSKVDIEMGPSWGYAVKRTDL